MSRLDLQVPPDLVALGVAGLMWLASAITPGVGLPPAIRLAVAALLIAFGLGLILAARIALQRARTTWSPAAPARSSRLVVGGVYSRTRNPMYLGTAFLLLGWAAVLGSPAGALVSVVFVAYIDRFQIAPEERILAARFGSEYAGYARRVRRWL